MQTHHEETIKRFREQITIYLYERLMIEEEKIKLVVRMHKEDKKLTIKRDWLTKHVSSHNVETKNDSFFHEMGEKGIKLCEKEDEILRDIATQLRHMKYLIKGLKRKKNSHEIQYILRVYQPLFNTTKRYFDEDRKRLHGENKLFHRVKHPHFRSTLYYVKKLHEFYLDKVKTSEEQQVLVKKEIKELQIIDHYYQKKIAPIKRGITVGSAMVVVAPAGITMSIVLNKMLNHLLKEASVMQNYRQLVLQT